MLIDLDSGATEDVLGDDPSAGFDAALTGDGRGVVISTCADLDPSVGNSDHNLELFLYDRDSMAFRQITDSRGGSTACARRGSAFYEPDVNPDGTRLAFALLHGYPGPPRALRNDFAFATVRAVPSDDGNAPPTLEAPGAQRAEVHSLFDVRFIASDPDGDPLIRFAQLAPAVELPVNASFVEHYGDDPSQSAFFWVAGPDDVGEHVLRVGRSTAAAARRSAKCCSPCAAVSSSRATWRRSSPRSSNLPRRPAATPTRTVTPG
jgi:hypothetical protein